MKHVSMKPG